MAFAPRDHLEEPKRFGQVDQADPAWLLTAPNPARAGIDPTLQYAAALVASATQHSWARAVRRVLAKTSLLATVSAGVRSGRLSSRTSGNPVSTHYQRINAWLHGELAVTADDMGTAMVLLGVRLSDPRTAALQVIRQVHTARQQPAPGSGPLLRDLDIITYAQGLSAGLSEAEARVAAERPEQPDRLNEADVAWLESRRGEPAWGWDNQARIEAAIVVALRTMDSSSRDAGATQHVFVRPAGEGDDVAVWGTVNPGRTVFHAVLPRTWPTEVLDRGLLLVDGHLVVDVLSQAGDVVVAASAKADDEEFVDDWGDWAPLGRQFVSQLCRRDADRNVLSPLGAPGPASRYGVTRRQAGDSDRNSS